MRMPEHRKSEFGATPLSSLLFFGSRPCREANQSITNSGLATPMSALQGVGATCSARLPYHCPNRDRSSRVECERFTRCNPLDSISNFRFQQKSRVRARRNGLKKIFKKELACEIVL